MFERLLFTAIQDGVTEIAGEPRTLTRLFSDLRGLQLPEGESLMDVFRRQPPEVYHQRPIDNANFPAYVIILDSEREFQGFLADDGGVLAEDEIEGLGPAPVISQLYDATFHIQVVGRHADVVLAYYQALKYVLNRQRAFLLENGMLNLVMSGSDIMTAPTYLPAHMFVRRLTLTVRYEDVTVIPQESPIRDVGGVFVNDFSVEARRANAAVEPSDE